MDFNIEKFEKHGDERGELVVFLKNSNLVKKQKKFGQIYFVSFEKKGIVRGNHYHKEWREWFGVVTGRLLVILKDIKTGEIKKMILNADTKQYKRLEIGPNIAHAFKNLSSRASLLNYTDKEWSPNDTFFELII